VLPGQSAEQNGGVVALELSEGALDGLVEVLDFTLLNARFLLETGALCCQALPDDVFGREIFDGLTVTRQDRQ
jgi:hypothetical protein